MSLKLVEILAEEYPGSAHVARVGLRGAPDRWIWEHPRVEAFAILSKDTEVEAGRPELMHRTLTTGSR